MLYQLSYASIATHNLERETRIELATNSLEGCDSTIELLPLFASRQNGRPRASGTLSFYVEFQRAVNFRGIRANKRPRSVGRGLE